MKGPRPIRGWLGEKARSCCGHRGRWPSNGGTPSPASATSNQQQATNNKEPPRNAWPSAFYSTPSAEVDERCEGCYDFFRMNPLVEKNRASIAESCRRFGVERLAVFGSAARGDFRPESSDVDFSGSVSRHPGAGVCGSLHGFRRDTGAFVGTQRGPGDRAGCAKSHISPSDRARCRHCL